MSRRTSVEGSFGVSRCRNSLPDENLLRFYSVHRSSIVDRIGGVVYHHQRDS